MTEGASWDATVLLCDAVQVAEGKLYVLGGGWSLCGPGPFVHGLGLKIDVPWDQTNRRHKLRTELVTEDGQPVVLGDPPDAISFETEFEVGRPPRLRPGTALDLAFAVNFSPLDLPADSGFAWLVTIDGQEIARRPFCTRPIGN
jgi:hypothetical protein